MGERLPLLFCLSVWLRRADDRNYRGADGNTDDQHSDDQYSNSEES